VLAEGCGGAWVGLFWLVAVAALVLGARLLIPDRLGGCG
jgi:hypothetical protein